MRRDDENYVGFLVRDDGRQDVDALCGPFCVLLVTVEVPEGYISKICGDGKALQNGGLYRETPKMPVLEILGISTEELKGHMADARQSVERLKAYWIKIFLNL